MTLLPKVLIVEDDPVIRSLLAAALRREPLIVHTANDGLHALEEVRQHRYAVLVVDLMMPRMNGAEFLHALPSATDARPGVLVLTAFDQLTTAAMIGEKAHLIVHKPFDLDRLVAVVRDFATDHMAADYDSFAGDRSLDLPPADPEAPS